MYNATRFDSTSQQPSNVPKEYVTSKDASLDEIVHTLNSKGYTDEIGTGQQGSEDYIGSDNSHVSSTYMDVEYETKPPKLPDIPVITTHIQNPAIQGFFTTNTASPVIVINKNSTGNLREHVKAHELKHYSNSLVGASQDEVNIDVQVSQSTAGLARWYNKTPTNTADIETAMQRAYHQNKENSGNTSSYNVSPAKSTRQKSELFRIQNSSYVTNEEPVYGQPNSL